MSIAVLTEEELNTVAVNLRLSLPSDVFNKFNANVNIYRTSWLDKSISPSVRDRNNPGEFLNTNITGLDALHQGIELDFIYKKAIENGALGGKLLGAGGGGFILFYASKEKHQEIINKLNHLIHVPFKFENLGSTVALYQPNGL